MTENHARGQWLGVPQGYCSKDLRGCATGSEYSRVTWRKNYLDAATCQVGGIHRHHCYESTHDANRPC